MNIRNIQANNWRGWWRKTRRKGIHEAINTRNLQDEETHLRKESKRLRILEIFRMVIAKYDLEKYREKKSIRNLQDADWKEKNG